MWLLSQELQRTKGRFRGLSALGGTRVDVSSCEREVDERNRNGNSSLHPPSVRFEPGSSESSRHLPGLPPCGGEGVEQGLLSLCCSFGDVVQPNLRYCLVFSRRAK